MEIAGLVLPQTKKWFFNFWFFNFKYQEIENVQP